MEFALIRDRDAQLRRGIVLEGLTVGYNTLEGLVAITAGLAAGSVALTGFGADSVIEVVSGVVLWWRLRAERSGLGLVVGRSGRGRAEGAADNAGRVGIVPGRRARLRRGRLGAMRWERRSC